MKLSSTIVFAVVFLSIFSITLAFPTVPPGEILLNFIYDSTGIPEITYSLLGFSGRVLLNSLINGILWGAFISVIYSIGSRASKRKMLLIPTSPPIPMQQRIVRPPPQKAYIPFPFIRASSKLDQDVETIEGIGNAYGSRLRFVGIRDVEDLLEAGATRSSRLNLAKEIGVPHNTVLRWVNQADLSRIRGIGKQYADLLDAAGVYTIIDLSRRNPRTLQKKLIETNREQNVVRRTPPFRTIESWIEHAKRLEQIVY